LCRPVYFACRNDNNDITIECTDKEGSIFSYKDKNGVIMNISGSELIALLNECFQELKLEEFQLLTKK
jgi:hypothetical protein